MIDIVERGKYGIGFESLEELAENIDMVISDERKFKLLSEVAQKRAETFSEERFRKEIAEILL